MLSSFEINAIKNLGQSTHSINASKAEFHDSLSAYLKDPNFGIDGSMAQLRLLFLL